MSDTSPSPKTRKLLAGVAAVVLTLGAAGAAVAVNLGTGAAVETPAGRLTATEPVSAPPTSAGITPSTIYVDLTVPVPAAGSAGSVDPAAPAPTDTAAPAAPAPTGRYDDDEGHDDDSYDDSDHGDDDRDESESYEHEEGADDDD